MPFSAQELSNIFSSTLDFYMDKGKVFKQNVEDKPMLKEFEASAGTFPGGKGNVSLAVKSGQGGGSLAGYTNDDQVTYYNPASQKRANYPWREHHIGIGVTHTELKIDGISVTEDGGDQSEHDVSGRDEFVLANLLQEKFDDLKEDYAVSWNTLLHSDGTGDPKALAGIRSLIIDAPAAGGTTGGIGRSANTWWNNRAATAANATAGGQGAITPSSTGGGALLQFLQAEGRQINRFAQGGVKRRHYAGSGFIGAMEYELRANGLYSNQGFGMKRATTGDMATVSWLNQDIVYDPLLDELGYVNRMYSLDHRRVRLLYMTDEKMKKTAPARPYDRYVLYRGITSTAVLIAQQLNTSGVYDVTSGAWSTGVSTTSGEYAQEPQP
jgi:hypothetical protein